MVCLRLDNNGLTMQMRLRFIFAVTHTLCRGFSILAINRFDYCQLCCRLLLIIVTLCNKDAKMEAEEVQVQVVNSIISTLVILQVDFITRNVYLQEVSASHCVYRYKSK